MIVYYDLVANVEVASDSFEESEPVKGIRAIQSKRITIEDKEVDIGANASADAAGGGEEDESVDASEAKSVINVVHAGSLQQINLSKSEYKTFQKAYWKKLLDALNKNKYKAIGWKGDYEPPEDKKEAKEAEVAAVAELSKFEIRGYDTAIAAIANFKANFETIQKFVTDTILANYDEMEFYTGDQCELGECMIIPARYVGEATAPVFYFFKDGIREKKE